MEFDRHDRVRSLLTGLVASFIREEANPNPLITVTNLIVSQNYRDVRVFITTIPDSGEKDALIFLKRKGTELRNFIKKNGRMQYIPNIDFEIDFGERHRQHIDSITHSIEEQTKKD
ncbi:MAG: ribosome-binding factor A [Candidatus Pacebacteria bacterium]|nr:ribosome-binding factor A [Candidatus Paceibacterota bacterium]MCF7857287.1 ribosome-binding factor A [Candidatus Paceibacterota bacterium]